MTFSLTELKSHALLSPPAAGMFAEEICKTRGTEATSQRITLEFEKNPSKEPKIQIVWSGWVSIHLVTPVTVSLRVAITKIPLL